ncbi:hypothetical protein EXIGLDRAFT_704420 [Exidia glandulosa HHB12029]|uniref:Uncharacterized protein n=1 Tax=Exidia glandulosa HHB12029 TaxID=1314781 RepID=A0A165BPM3_EXIGL|nr:hypothetical protein EXIGLDRAFT_704420 [Exidia glandulosa HHB12029]
MPPRKEVPKWTIEYIRSARARVVNRKTRRARIDFDYCAQWSGFPRCDEYYSSDNYDEEDIKDFWRQLDDRTLPPDRWFQHDWVAYSNQTYRDAKIIEDVERRELALTVRTADVAATCPESAEALRPSRDKFLPEVLEAELRERWDFSLRGDFISEVEEWSFKPTVSCKTKGRAPFPASCIRQRDEDLEHDYRLTILKQGDEEDPYPYDDNVAAVLAGDGSFLPPAVATIRFGDDGWPLGLQRIAFSEEKSLLQTLFATFGKDIVRKFTRWWRRKENRTYCLICMDSIDELGEKAFSTECMHIFCKVRYAQDASTSLTRKTALPSSSMGRVANFRTQMLPMQETHALLDPCRVHRLKPAPPASSLTAEQQQPPALSTANVGLGSSNDSEGGDPPSSAGRKKKNRRGGKLRKKELARKKKAEGRVKDGARGGA